MDEEFLAAALDFIDRNNKSNTPWFCYFNSTRMHVWTHLKASSEGKTGLGIYPDGMVELDGYVGQLLEKLEALGTANNTIVVFTTDNGAEEMTWPDGRTTPFRGEKATNWEGGYRVPMLIRWPGTIQPGTIYNDFIASYDLLPTFVAAGGNPDIVAQCLKGLRSATRPSRFTSTVTTSSHSSKVRRSNRRVRISSIGMTMANSSPSGFATGRSSSRNKTIRESAFGRGNLRTCAFQSCSTSAPILSSAATSRFCTTSGWLIEYSSRFRHRHWSLNGCKRFKSFRSGRSQPHSIWMQ